MRVNAVVCDLSDLAGPQREPRNVRRMTLDQREYFERKADEYGCRDVLRCLAATTQEPPNE